MGEGGGLFTCCKCLEISRISTNFFGFREGIMTSRNPPTVKKVSFIKKGFYIRGSVPPNRCVFSMHQEKSRSKPLESFKQKRVPIFVMLPDDTFIVDASGNPRIRKVKAITASLRALKMAGVHGITVEVWWGIVERSSPSEYNWCLYEEMFKLISESGLKLHVALSFHSSVPLSSNAKGGISLPLWIMEVGRLNRNIYYRDQNGFSNDDYLTLGVDEVPLFFGRTALQCYEDFMLSFMNTFDPLMGRVIEEISIGLGPSGELRYPAHPSNDGRWRFPGIGEFQCYDKYMLEDLEMAAWQEGKPEWGCKGPQNAGSYNSLPSGIPFFEDGGESFLSDYGRFFLEWYSGRLLHHADVILAKAANMLKKYQDTGSESVLLVAKIAVIYWWYKTDSHPAELTAGYYNTSMRDGYEPLASVLSRHRAALHISCLEMFDGETSATYFCSPESLIRQIWKVSKKRIIEVTGRNSTQRLDKEGLAQMFANCYHPYGEAIKSFTYFQMNERVFRVENWNNFTRFVRSMNAEL